MLDLDAVFFEEIIFQRRVEMDETAGDRTGRDARPNRRITGFSDVRVGLGILNQKLSRAEKFNKRRAGNPC